MTSRIKRVAAVCLILALLVPVSVGTVSAATRTGAETTVQKSPRKKWCKKHKKKCRQALRKHAKAPGRIVRARVKNYKFNANGQKSQPMGGYTVYEDPQTGEQTAVGSGAGDDPAFWKKNGAAPGGRKGCRQVVGFSEDWGRWGPLLLFKFRKYRYASRKFWCWKKGRVLPGTVEKAEFVVDTDRFIRPNEHGFVESHMYRWRGRRNGGHFHEARANLEACLEFIIAFCPTAQFHPYIRIYAHGDGSYHMSGHDF
jgi:hypothetical protein